MAEHAYYNSKILEWARVRLGFSLEEAAISLGLSSSARLEKAESYESPLTARQLGIAAKKYLLPLPYFFLEKIPNIERKQTQNFRLNAAQDLAYTPEINRVLFWAQDIREQALDLSESGHISLSKLPWQFKSDENIDFISETIHTNLGFHSLNYTRVEHAFQWWKETIESLGVLVLETDHHQKFTLSGSAIHFDECPIIILNGTEKYKRKKLFTLLHEFSHLVYGDSSLDEFQSQIKQNDSVEKACNDLANQLLVPRKELEIQFNQNSGTLYEIVTKLSNTFSVSRFVITIALRQAAIISFEDSSELYEQLEMEFASSFTAKLDKRRAKTNKGGGPPPYIRKSIKLSNTYSRAVLSAFWAGDIRQTEATRMLDNLHINHFEKLATRVFQN